MNKYKKLMYNVFFILIGNIGSKLISFLLLPFYTKYLSPEFYGELNMVTMAISFLAPILTLQFSMAVFRFANQKSEKEQEKIVSIALIAILPLMITASFLIKIIIESLKIDFLMKYYNYIFIILIFNYLNSVFREKLRTDSRIKLYSMIGVIETFIGIGLNVYFVPKLYVKGMLISLTYSSLIALIILLYVNNFTKIFKFQNWSFKIFKEMLSYALPLIPNSILWGILSMSDRIFLKYYHGLEEVGLYSLANKFSMIITVIFSIFYNSLQITILEEYRKKDFSRFFYNIFYNISLLQMFIVLGVSLTIKYIIGFMVADTYEMVWKYVSVLLTTVVINNYSSILGLTYLLKKNTKALLKSSIVASFINILFNFLLIPKYSILGAIIATLISYIVLFYIREKDIKEFFKIETNFYVGNIIIIFISILPNLKNEIKHINIINIIGLFIFLFIQRKQIGILFNFLLDKLIKTRRLKI